MKCGFYELDITPPLGSIIPGAFGARYANEILDRLYARAVAVRGEGMGLAVVSIDACGITMDITERIRSRVCEMTQLKPEQIMVVATHAHGAGPTLNWGEEVVTDAHYLQMLVNRAADSIICAWNKAEEAELFAGREELHGISFIRVYQMKDGSLKTNPGFVNADKIDCPTATIDPEVGVLAVRQNGVYTGAVVNFATHPATIATRQITGDYISILSKELKRVYGEDFVTVFINGACGDINHIDPFDPATGEKYVRYRYVGEQIAQAVVSAIGSAKPMTDCTLCAECSEITVKFRKPSPEYLMAAKETFESLGDGLIDSVPGTPGYIDTFFALQAFKIMADKRTQRQVELQVFRIGSCYIFGTPCQLFVQFGKRMKEACEGMAFVSAFANDYCGYVPTPECMREGVYEARLAPTSALEPEAGDKVCEGIIALYQKLKS